MTNSIVKEFFLYLIWIDIFTSGSQRNIQSSGGTFRSRLGSYADVLRTVVMQQIIDSGGSLNGLELEEIEVFIHNVTPPISVTIDYLHHISIAILGRIFYTHYVGL